ncbi:MAG: hypothetical protein KW788_02045 [Candidatus Doudnabacteria bacterium]|nr:hypothetical protein [Candidatus Doudnabacteria bacterium]
MKKNFVIVGLFCLSVASLSWNFSQYQHTGMLKNAAAQLSTLTTHSERSEFAIVIPFEDTPVLMRRADVEINGVVEHLVCGREKYDANADENRLWFDDKLVAKLETPMSQFGLYEGHKPNR